MPELAEPDEGLSILDLLSDEFLHHVPGMDVDGADSHDTLSVCLGHVAQEEVDEDVELRHLLLVVVLESILVALLQSVEGQVDFCCPPHLGASQSHLHNTHTHTPKCTCTCMCTICVHNMYKLPEQLMLHLCWRFKNPLLSGFILVCNNGLIEFVFDGLLHGLQQ